MRRKIYGGRGIVCGVRMDTARVKVEWKRIRKKDGHKCDEERF